MQYDIQTTPEFDQWLDSVSDTTVRYRLDARFFRLRSGNFGDSKSLKGDLYELRFTFGGGIRVYYTFSGDTVVLLLIGGNKSSQKKDIAVARSMINNEG
jgi:putative addiction module killer protein